jgi:hypothetical protein
MDWGWYVIGGEAIFTGLVLIYFAIRAWRSKD